MENKYFKSFNSIDDVCSQGKIVEKMKQLKKNEFFRRNFSNNKELYTTGNFSDIFACDLKVVKRRLSSEHHPTMLNENTDYFEKKHQEFVREKWFSVFKESPKIKLIDTNVMLVDKNISIHGMLDCAIKIGEVIITTNIYSLDNENYNKVVESGAHRKDILYMLLCMCLSDTSNGLIIYENKVNNGNEFFEVKADSMLVRSMFRDIDRLNRYVREKKMPVKPYKSISKECQNCFFKKQCWE